MVRVQLPYKRELGRFPTSTIVELKSSPAAHEGLSEVPRVWVHLDWFAVSDGTVSGLCCQTHKAEKQKNKSVFFTIYFYDSLTPDLHG